MHGYHSRFESHEYNMILESIHTVNCVLWIVTEVVLCDCWHAQSCVTREHVDALSGVNMSFFSHSYFILGTSTPNGGFV